MRILFTVNSYYPNQDGVQFVTKYLAEGLVKLHNEVSLITYWHPDRTDIKSEIVNGVNIIRWNATTVHTFHKGDKLGYQNYIIKHQDDFDIIVNIGTQTALTDWLFQITHKIKIPKVLYIHSIWDFKFHFQDFKNFNTLCSKIWANIRWKIYYLINSNQFKKYNLIIQLHEMDYSYRFFLKKYDIESKVIENAADKEFFKVKKYKLNLPEHYIINVSNYMDRKNQKQCIEVFLKSDIPDNWELILIGSKKNSYYEDLIIYEKKLRSDLKLGDRKKIHILVDVPRKYISDYVKNAEIYLMTSKWEAFPISLIESMASGVPFISSDVGIVKYLSGGVIARGIDEYKFWLKKMTNNKKIREEYGRIGKVTAISNFQIEDKVLQFQSYLKSILNEK